MPKININGTIREMTQDEIKQWEQDAALIPQQEPTAEERLAALEAAFTALLEGETE